MIEYEHGIYFRASRISVGTYVSDTYAIQNNMKQEVFITITSPQNMQLSRSKQIGIDWKEMHQLGVCAVLIYVLQHKCCKSRNTFSHKQESLSELNTQKYVYFKISSLEYRAKL
jgi:hypothetical protein